MSERKNRGYWNFEMCKIEALKYKSKGELLNNCSSAYNSISKNNWGDELYSHMENKHRRSRNYWTKENCQIEAYKYTTIKDFRREAYSAYTTSVKQKWICDICLHMKILGNSYKRFIYAYEFYDNHVYVGLTYNVEERDNNHKKRGTVFNYIKETGIVPILKQLVIEPVDVNEAVRLERSYLEDYISNGWIPLNVAPTGSIGGGNVKWTFDKIKEIALNYTNITDFNRDYSWAYQVAKTKNWLGEIMSHMIIKNKPRGYWDYNKCKEEAFKYTSRKAFGLNSSVAYSKARKNEWLDDICSHMSSKKPRGYYTLNKCIELAKNCKNLKKFKEDYPSAHTYMYRNKWTDEIKQHFKEINILSKLAKKN